MNNPKGVELHSDTEWVIKRNKNIYGQSQAGRILNKFLVEKLTSSEVGFRRNKID